MQPYDTSLETSNQERTNAAIAYFFLAPLFLIAKRNPNFAHPFVRAHAKSATKLIAVFVVIFILYKTLLAPIAMNISIPLLLVDGDRVASIAFFAILLFSLLRWARRAFVGRAPTTSVRESLSLRPESVSFDSRGMTDTDKVLATLSFMPFLGTIIARKHPNPITLSGEKCGAIFAMLYAFFLSSGSASIMILLFVGILAMVTVGVLLFTGQPIPGLSILEKIPNLTELYQMVRATPLFVLDILHAAFGKKAEVSFVSRFLEVKKSEATFVSEMEKGFSQDEKSPFSAGVVAIPMVNLVFLPSLCFAKSFRLVIAAGQGIMMTALLAISFYLYGFFAPETFVFLFPISLLLANSEDNPFYRIPVMYELYTLIGILSFGLTDRARKVRSISQKEESVNYKV